MVAYVSHVFFCPRCGRKHEAPTRAQVEEDVKGHVADAHPDYDPDWWDTYPANDAQGV
jgi:hypothetical protein